MVALAAPSSAPALAGSAPESSAPPPTSADPGVASAETSAPFTAPLPSSAAPPLPRASCPWPTLSIADKTRHFVATLGAGCGPRRAAPGDVSAVRIVEVALEPGRTVVRFVLLDAASHRLTLERGDVTLDLALASRERLTYRFGQKPAPADGIYELGGRANDFPKPCSLSLSLAFVDGARKLDDWVDDWNYSC